MKWFEAIDQATSGLACIYMFLYFYPFYNYNTTQLKSSVDFVPVLSIAESAA